MTKGWKDPWTLLGCRGNRLGTTGPRIFRARYSCDHEHEVTTTTGFYPHNSDTWICRTDDAVVVATRVSEWIEQPNPLPPSVPDSRHTQAEQ